MTTIVGWVGYMTVLLTAQCWRVLETLEIVDWPEFLQFNLVDMILREAVLVSHVTGPHQGQDHWEKHQAVEQPEHHHEEEHLEEDHEGVVVRGGQQNHRQQSGETAVENCGTNLEQRVLDPDINNSCLVLAFKGIYLVCYNWNLFFFLMRAWSS